MVYITKLVVHQLYLVYYILKTFPFPYALIICLNPLVSKLSGCNHMSLLACFVPDCFPEIYLCCIAGLSYEAYEEPINYF